MKFRQAFGLPHDEPALAAADAAPSHEGLARYGATLTAVEYAEQSRRDGWALNSQGLSAVLDQHADQLGGTWIDQAADGGFVVVTTPSTAPATRAAVLAAAPVGAPVRFALAEYPTVALSSASAALTEAQVDMTDPSGTDPGNPLVALYDEGFEVTASWINVRDNRLVVGFKRLPAEHRDELAAQWDEQVTAGKLPLRALTEFRQTGMVVPQESRSNSPGHMKGGLRLTGPLGPLNAESYCTSNMTAGGGILMTAGHCFNSGTTSPFKHYGQTLGTSAPTSMDGFVNGSNADVMGIQLNKGGFISPNMFAAFACPNGVDTCQQIDTASSAQNATIFGQRVCMGGVSTYWITCGMVAGGSGTFASAGSKGAVTFTDHVLAMNYPSTGGDSGAVVGNGDIVHGIHHGSMPDESVKVFAQIGNALARVGNPMVTGPAGTPVTWTMLESVQNNSKCMDVSGNSSVNGTRIIQWPCNGNPAQQWTFIPTGTMNGGFDLYYNIKRFALGTKCLDLDIGAGGGPGAKIQAWDCNGWSNQKWKLHRRQDWTGDASGIRLISQYNGLCAVVNNSDANDGAHIVAEYCAAESFGLQRQLWRVR